VPGTAATWCVLARGQRGAAFEERAESFDEVGRPVSEIEQGPFLELAVDPIALAQQNGRRGVAQAIQIIVTVLAVATSSAVFVAAIRAFVALTLHKFGRVSRSSDRTVS